MSEKALIWVVEAAPDVSPHWIPVLLGLARHADEQGRGAYPSQELLAEYARKSDRAVRNDLTALQKVGLIRPGDRKLVEQFPPDHRPLVWDLALERSRILTATDWKPTSGRSGRKSASSRSTAGNTSESTQNRRSEKNDRKHSSTRYDRKHSSTRSDASQNSEAAGQQGTTGSTLPPKSSNYVSKQQQGTPIPDWAQPLINDLQMKGIAVGWGRLSHFQWITVQQLMKSHGVPYLVYIAKTRWNPSNPIRFGSLLLDIWREFPAPPPGSPWHPDTLAARSQKKNGSAGKPPHCGHPDCDEQTRTREIEDTRGIRSLERCPDCHPNAKGQAA